MAQTSGRNVGTVRKVGKETIMGKHMRKLRSESSEIFKRGLLASNIVFITKLRREHRLKNALEIRDKDPFRQERDRYRRNTMKRARSI